MSARELAFAGVAVLVVVALAGAVWDTAFHRAPTAWEAAREGDVRRLAVVLGDSNERNRHQQTPLISAAIGRQHETAEFLLRRGAEVNARDVRGWSALHYAAGARDPELARLLLASGADIHAATRRSENVVTVAVRWGYEDVLFALLDAGADADLADADGATPLMYAAERRSGGAAIRALLDHGADARHANAFGETALDWALEHGRKDNVGSLATADTLPGGPDWRRLVLASLRGDVARVGSLLEGGTPIDQRTRRHQRTALMLASSEGLDAVVKVLLDHDANVELADRDGATALKLAGEQDHARVVTRLLQAGAEQDSTTGITSALTSAAANGSDDAVEAFLAAGIGIDSRDASGATALMWAATFGRVSTVETLLRNGAFVDAVDERGATALMRAAGGPAKCHGSVVDGARRLIAAGAAVGVRDSRGSSAIHHAAQAGNAEMILFLLENGANVNSTDKYGFTPLEYAIGLSGSLEAAQALLRHGAETGEIDYSRGWWLVRPSNREVIRWMVVEGYGGWKLWIALWGDELQYHRPPWRFRTDGSSRLGS